MIGLLAANALFLAVGASTGAAAIALRLMAMGRGNMGGLARVRLMIVLALLIQLASLIVFVAAVQASGSPASVPGVSLILNGPFRMTFCVG